MGKSLVFNEPIPENKKKLYLHIGSHKTGTTALQNFLENNYEVLISKGVLYPKFSDESFIPHHIIMRPIANPKKHDYIWDLDELTPKAVELDSLFSINSRLLTEVERYNPSIVIISTEFLFEESNVFDNTVKNSLKFSYLRRLFDGFDIEVLCYLREPISWINSCYIEAIKGAHTCFDGSFQDYLLRLNPSDLNWAKKIEPWIENFGVGNVNIRFYEAFSSHEGIEIDFLACLGLNPNDFKFETKKSKKNISYDTNWVRLLRSFNSVNNRRKQEAKYSFPFSIEQIAEGKRSASYFHRRKEFPDDILLSIRECTESLKEIQPRLLDLWDDGSYENTENEVKYEETLTYVVEQFLIKMEEEKNEYKNVICKAHIEINENHKLIQKLEVDLSNLTNDNLRLLKELKDTMQEVKYLRSEFSLLRYFKSKLCILVNWYRKLVNDEKNISNK